MTSLTTINVRTDNRTTTLIPRDGVLFNRNFESGPPFGGNKEEYLEYFSKYFSNIYMENCYNSVLPRKGSELFIQIQH